jgi:hypothetical protein
MLPQLEALQVSTFRVVDNDPIDENNFLFKIRCELTGYVLRIRLRAVAGRLRYSYQEFAEGPLRRWDNAPHFPDVPNFPHHHHNLEGAVVESVLRGDPIADLPQVLDAL